MADPLPQLVQRLGQLGRVSDERGRLTRTFLSPAMRQATPTLTLQDSAFSFSFMPPGATSWSSGTGGPGDIGKVTVDYSWTLMTPLLRPFFPSGQFHMTVSAAMKNEARFQ